nr:MAG TPA: hypothetical protein [Caudoviricetes sp.]
MHILLETATKLEVSRAKISYASIGLMRCLTV